MNIRIMKWLIAAIGSALAFATLTAASAVTISQRIEPANIGVGEAAQLTITASGSDTPQITPPMVPGLEFVAVGQSQRTESVNGITNTTSSVTYQVTPRQAGVYTIPSVASGSQPVVLTVNAGAGAGGSNSAAAAATAATPALSAEQVRLGADGNAFVRLHVAKHELYVGETIPVDIEVGMRDGFVASLNGPPMLNGDAFTLHQLPAEPQRTEEIIDGEPFTVLAWHSALAAIKPGTLSLTIETPLTVRAPARAHAAVGDLFGEAGLDDFFKDPLFQNFFGASTERDITLASKPAHFTVLALPTHDRPADFSGAVGHFSISSDFSDPQAAAGDPVTLRLHIVGTGDFDRVTTPMLHDVEHWKTYAPTATFKAQDGIGYRGEKTLEQPLIAMQAGTQSLPPLTFSWFDPGTRQYVEARTSPPPIRITPAPSGTTVAREASAPAGSPATPLNAKAGPGLRADHVVNGASVASLTPYYYQPVYLGVPGALVLSLTGAWLWLRRRDQAEADAQGARPSLDPEPLLRVMDDAAAAGDPTLFFQSARAALQRKLASRWHLSPDAITLDELCQRLGADSDVARVFRLADETAYAGIRLAAPEFQRWKQLIFGHIHDQVAS